MSTETVVSAVGVTKRYGANVALHPTDFTLAAGQCVGVIGENGAGKSTFAKVLTGAEAPDAGELVVSGEKVSFRSPRDALARGVTLIPQELAYVPELSVAENIMLNRLPTRRGFTSPRSIERSARQVMDQAGLHVEPSRMMGGLSLADQQIVEILKALGRGSRVLVLDEPTAALTEDESHQLFRILREQQQRGLAVLLISHRLDEVMRHADRIDVFRNGHKTFVALPAETPATTLISEMLGAPVADTVVRRTPVGHDVPVMTIEGWEADGLPGLRGLNAELRQHEILGVYGIRGSGAEILAEGLAGSRPRIHGHVAIRGDRRQVFRTPREAINAGVACVPQDRKRSGLVLGLSVRRSVGLMLLRALSSFGVIDRAEELRIAEDWIARFRIQASSPEQAVGELSGGNQQKVLLAGRLAVDPQVLVVHEPTRGVDIGARREIHGTLRALSDAGKAVLLITSDVEEAVTTSDRLLIIRDGRVVAELTGANITEERAMQEASV